MRTIQYWASSHPQIALQSRNAPRVALPALSLPASASASKGSKVARENTPPSEIPVHTCDSHGVGPNVTLQPESTDALGNHGRSTLEADRALLQATPSIH